MNPLLGHGRCPEYLRWLDGDRYGMDRGNSPRKLEYGGFLELTQIYSVAEVVEEVEIAGLARC